MKRIFFGRIFVTSIALIAMLGACKEKKEAQEPIFELVGTWEYEVSESGFTFVEYLEFTENPNEVSIGIRAEGLIDDSNAIKLTWEREGNIVTVPFPNTEGLVFTITSATTLVEEREQIVYTKK